MTFMRKDKIITVTAIYRPCSSSQNTQLIEETEEFVNKVLILKHQKLECEDTRKTPFFIIAGDWNQEMKTSEDRKYLGSLPVNT